MNSSLSPRPRRNRRSQTEVMQRLVDAARAQFAARGYALATTRDIAKEADVSETLLFRYFGSKAGLFDDVMLTPFHKIARQFLDAATQAGGQAPSLDAITACLRFLEQNRDLALTLARDRAETEDEHNPERRQSMQQLYAEGAALVRARYKKTGGTPTVAPELAARLGFGMVLATSLFADWLFPEGAPPPETLARAIDALLKNIFNLASPIDGVPNG